MASHDGETYAKFAYVYDQLMRQMPYPSWLRFLRECWERYGEPSTIVDLGCGTGELTLPLAERGYRMIGIDLSEDMLTVAREKAAAFPSIRWERQNMREWLLHEPIDCVFSFCDCLNYLLEEEDIRRTFRSTYNGLAEGGLFLFDVHAPSYLLTLAEDQPYMLNEEDIAYIWTSDYDPERWQVEHEITFFTKQNVPNVDPTSDSNRFIRFRESHRQRAYAPEWLSDELRRAGFHVLERCADFRWTTPDEESERIFFVARKLT